jgi:hypothetical protein
MAIQRYRIISTALFSLFIVSMAGCQAPASVTQMQAENKALERELNDAKNEISVLKIQEKELQASIDELNRVAAVLGTEKTSRVAESSQLRRQVRQFVQQHIDDLKAFMVEGNLLDYVGSELIERTQEHVVGSTESAEPLLLVDFANPIPAAGVLTGVGGIATAPADLTVKVLRKIDQQWLVVWTSHSLTFSNSGYNRESFPVNVGVEKGDLVAYYFPQSASISFDSGTGQTLYRRDDISIGGLLKLNSLDGRAQQRAYSLGVYGLLRD